MVARALLSLRPGLVQNIYIRVSCLLLVSTLTLWQTLALTRRPTPAALPSTPHTLSPRSAPALDPSTKPRFPSASAVPAACRRAVQYSTLYPGHRPPPPPPPPQTGPAWCGNLIARPRGSPMQRPCGRAGVSELCRDGGPAFFGQLNHDMYLWDRHWSKMTRKGVYLDLAANHAVDISNTYFLDRCLGWHGVCVEANPCYLDELTYHRRCSLKPTCVSDKEGHKVNFTLFEGLSGIEDTNKNQDRWASKGGDLSGRTKTLQLECTRVQSLLDEEDVSRIDYMSLDLEGHELHALRGFDWNKTRVDIVSLEAEPNSAVARFLLDLGYRQHVPADAGNTQTSITGDEIYLHADVVLGSPT